MRKSLLLLIACVFVCSVSLLAQTRTITGKVTGADDGHPIPGAAVMVKGTSIGTVTNADGVYSIQVPQNSQAIVISYLGYVSQEALIQGRSSIDVVLDSEMKNVDEVIVTALGVSKEKKALGYAVADVKGEELMKAKGGVANPINSLAGKVAGLQISGASAAIQQLIFSSLF